MMTRNTRTVPEQSTSVRTMGVSDHWRFTLIETFSSKHKEDTRSGLVSTSFSSMSLPDSALATTLSSANITNNSKTLTCLLVNMLQTFFSISWIFLQKRYWFVTSLNLLLSQAYSSLFMTLRPPILPHFVRNLIILYRT